MSLVVPRAKASRASRETNLKAKTGRNTPPPDTRAAGVQGKAGGAWQGRRGWARLGEAERAHSRVSPLTFDRQNGPRKYPYLKVQIKPPLCRIRKDSDGMPPF